MGRSVLQVKTLLEDLDVILNGTRLSLPPFSQRVIQEFMRERTKEEGRAILRDGLGELELARAETDALIKGKRSDPCPFFRLPLTVRARLWESLFSLSEDRWVVAPNTEIPGAGLLRMSGWIQVEASIAFAQALVSQRMILLFYPDHCFLRRPFPLFAKLGDRILRELTLPLGDSRDSLKGMKRSLDFVHFLKVLRAQHPLMVYELTIFIQKSWKLPQIGFDEDGLAKSLVSGAFAFFNKITITGVASEADFPELARCLRIRTQEK